VGTKGLFPCGCRVCSVYFPSTIVNSLNLAMREVGAAYPNVADVCAYISYRWHQENVKLLNIAYLS
jgi:hypothetical protein